MNQKYQSHGKSGLRIPMWIVVFGVIVITAVVCFSAWVESEYPSVEYIELHYQLGVSARVYYNPYQGIPNVDSTMTDQQLCAIEYVDSVRWDVPEDNRQAQTYWAISLLHADPNTVEQFLDNLFP